MAALASIDRPDRGPASAVDLLTRLRGPLPAPEPIERPEPRPDAWPRVEVPPGSDRLVHFRLELEAARRAGVPFEAAWKPAQLRAFRGLGERGAAGRKEQYAFVSATNATRAEWGRAYRRVGERLRIVDALMAAIEGDEDRTGGIRTTDPGD